MDASGNVYIADTGNDAIKEWNAATQTVSTLVSSGLIDPAGVAVDGSGNVYIADSGDNAIKEWNAATQTLSTLVSSGLNHPVGRGGGRLGQCLHRRCRQQRDRGAAAGLRAGQAGQRRGGGGQRCAGGGAARHAAVDGRLRPQQRPETG